MSLEFTWFGKSCADLSRDELLAIIEYLSAELKKHRTTEAIRATALGRVEMIKRGET